MYRTSVAIVPWTGNGDIKGWGRHQATNSWRLMHYGFSGGSSAENRTGNDESLDFRGAFVNLRDPLVAVQFLHHVVLDETIPAVDLHGGVDGPVGGLRGEQLCHA